MENICEKNGFFLAYYNPGHPWESTIGPAVWPALDNIYIYTNVLFYYIDKVIGCPIITQKPHGLLASTFDWGILENPGNVLSLVLNSKLSGLTIKEKPSDKAWNSQTTHFADFFFKFVIFVQGCVLEFHIFINPFGIIGYLKPLIIIQTIITTSSFLIFSTQKFYASTQWMVFFL